MIIFINYYLYLYCCSNLWNINSILTEVQIAINIINLIEADYVDMGYKLVDYLLVLWNFIIIFIF
jgi:hypothetical protein